MSTITGHAAFHLSKNSPRHSGTPSGTRSQRRALLKESMRHLDPKDVARHAAKNASIVSADTHLNIAYVNDGSGGFRVVSTVKEVLAYGDAREARVRRKIAEGQSTVSLFVVHLPKTLCFEEEDFYPRHNADGSQRLDPITGRPMSRSRWIARDQSEAMRYFADAIAFLGDSVIPGGHDAIHGWATNFDETTPHIQLMADPFAIDPKAPATAPDALRTEQNQAYGSHRETRGLDGKQISGNEKMRQYQALMRAHMVGRGWPVEIEPGERHGRGQSKSEYEATQDAKADAASLHAAASAAEARADDTHAAALSIHETAIDLVSDAIEAMQVAEVERRQEMEETREELYGQLGVEYAELRKKHAQVDDVLDIERRMMAADRTKEQAEHQRAVDSLTAQTGVALARERAADEREREADARRAEFNRKVSDARELFAAAQELGRQTVELARANKVRLTLPNGSMLKQARSAHDELVSRLLRSDEVSGHHNRNLEL
ncbi:MAG: hypothetical protein JST33_06410 [Actinobacteria bacterium]|nr:hypothetical protein [Actinomycetota bacterium]